MSLTGWSSVARCRSCTIFKIKDQEFVMASTTLGASSSRIIFKHLFPTIIGQLVVMATFSIPASYCDRSDVIIYWIRITNPQSSSLGVLLSDGTSKMTILCVFIICTSLLYGVFMLAINLFANGLRDALDPRLRGK